MKTLKILTLPLLLMTSAAIGQISFQSKPLQSTPYVSPIDQNLVFDAMRSKQTSHDAGVKTISAQIKRTAKAVQELYEVKPERAKELDEVKVTLINIFNRNDKDFSDPEFVSFWTEKFEMVEFEALKAFRK